MSHNLCVNINNVVKCVKFAALKTRQSLNTIDTINKYCYSSSTQFNDTNCHTIQHFSLLWLIFVIHLGFVDCFFYFHFACLTDSLICCNDYCRKSLMKTFEMSYYWHYHIIEKKHCFLCCAVIQQR